MDQETWRFINTFAPWLAALGTFAAVLVSLYLARKSDRIALNLRVGIRAVASTVGHGRFVLLRFSTRGGVPKVVWINITNVGRRSATITHIYLRPLFWRQRGYPWVVPPTTSPYSMEFPTTLADGKSADYAWILPEFEKQVTQEFRDEFSGIPGAIRLRLSRVCVATSTGDVFCCKPEKELRELLRTMATAPP